MLIHKIKIIDRKKTIEKKKNKYWLRSEFFKEIKEL